MSLNRILKNSFLYLPSQILRPLVAFLAIPIYTKILTVDEYGHFVIVMTTINFMILSGANWISSSILRFNSVYSARNEKIVYISTLTHILIASSLLVSLIAVALFRLTSIFQHFSDSIVVLLIGIFIFTSIFEVLLSLVRAEERAKLYSVYFITFTLAKTSVGIILLLFFRRFEAILIGWIIVTLVMIVLFSNHIGIASYVKVKNVSWLVVKEILFYGLPFIFADLGGIALDQIDRYMIMHFRGSAEVGVYNVSYLISSYSISIFYTCLTMSGYPAVVSAWEKEGKSATLALTINLLRIYFILCLPALFVISIVSKEILTMLFPQEYVVGYQIVPWVASGAFIVGLFQYQQRSAFLLKKSYYYGAIYILGAGLNFLLNMFLIPRYGLIGAAWATTIAYFFVFIIMTLLNKFILKLHWVFPKKSIFKISVSSIFMGIILYYLKEFYINGNSILGLSILLFTGFFIYFVLLRILNEIQDGEIAKAINLVTRGGFYKKLVVVPTKTKKSN